MWRHVVAPHAACGFAPSSICEYILKIDPGLPGSIAAYQQLALSGHLSQTVAGDVDNPGESTEVIQGGAQLFHHTVIERIIASNILNRRELRNPYQYLPEKAQGQLIQPRMLSQGYMTSDYQLAYIMRQVGLKPIVWNDCKCYPQTPAGHYETAKFPITHPHKVQAPQIGFPPDEALHVIVTCKGRWFYLKQTIAAFSPVQRHADSGRLCVRPDDTHALIRRAQQSLQIRQASVASTRDPLSAGAWRQQFQPGPRT